MIYGHYLIVIPNKRTSVGGGNLPISLERKPDLE